MIKTFLLKLVTTFSFFRGQNYVVSIILYWLNYFELKLNNKKD